MHKVTIWTDGGCSPNPGFGAWAAILKHGNTTKEISGTEANTTNNRMELYAVIAALEALKAPCEVTIISDSQWVVNCGSRAWGRSANVDLWEQYDKAASDHAVTFQWVRGHNGDAMNECCHTLIERALRQAVR